MSIKLRLHHFSSSPVLAETEEQEEGLAAAVIGGDPIVGNVEDRLAGQTGRSADKTEHRMVSGSWQDHVAPFFFCPSSSSGTTGKLKSAILPP